MTIAEKITRIAEDMPKIYEAGKKSMVDENKIIPKTVSGNFISLDDVSEVPHNVTCKVSGVDDLTSVQVTKCGKNLAQENDFTSNPEAGYKTYRAFTPIPANVTFTISGNFSTNSGQKMFYRIMSADGTDLSYGFIHQSMLPKVTITATLKDKASFLYLYAGENAPMGVGYTLTVNNFQIELGDKATAYNPYTSQKLTPNSDGTVEGMTSISPHMNIFTETEGANIEVTYNKSWGMQEERTRFYNNFQQGKINSSISFEWLTIDKAGITDVINALSDDSTGQTLTLKKLSKEAAFTEAEWQTLVSAKPNWDIALV